MTTQRPSEPPSFGEAALARYNNDLAALLHWAATDPEGDRAFWSLFDAVMEGFDPSLHGLMSQHKSI